jgi:hypothetical protein
MAWMTVAHGIENSDRRREYFDFVPFWTVRDLESKLFSFKEFYNDRR